LVSIRGSQARRALGRGGSGRGFCRWCWQWAACNAQVLTIAGESNRTIVDSIWTAACTNWHTSSATVGQAGGGTSRGCVARTFHTIVVEYTHGASFDRAQAANIALGPTTTDASKSEATITTLYQTIDTVGSDIHDLTYTHNGLCIGYP